MLGDYRVGPQQNQDSAAVPLRCMKDFALAKADAHAHFREAVYRGGVYCASTAISVDTGTGAVAPGTALGTTMAMVLYNPVGSGVNLDIWRLRMIWLPGATGNTTVMGVGQCRACAVAADRLARRHGHRPGVLPHRQRGRGQGEALHERHDHDGADLVRPTSISIQAITAAGPTATNGWVWEELFDGEFLLLPGNVLCVGAVAAAGTTPLVGLGLTWEETPS